MKVKELIEHLKLLPDEAKECELELIDFEWVIQNHCGGDRYKLADVEYRGQKKPDEGYECRVVFNLDHLE